MLKVTGLRKRFGAIEAVKGVSFEVERGVSFGLLGPNGAGKTTTISMIVGGLDADEGTITLDGSPMSQRAFDAKRKVGYVPQEIALYEELSATENLQFFGAMYDLGGDDLRTAMDRALELAGLSDRRLEPVSRFSGGMKRRLNIAIALLHQPPLLILDEPTVGVDPQSRNAIFETLERLHADGLTILYTTHYMEEVERLCSEVAIMDRGEIVAHGSLDELRSAHAGVPQLTFDLSSPLNVADAARLGVEANTHRITLPVANLGLDLTRVSAELRNLGVEILAVRSSSASLEEVFLSLTGSSLRD